MMSRIVLAVLSILATLCCGCGSNNDGKQINSEIFKTQMSAADFRVEDVTFDSRFAGIETKLSAVDPQDEYQIDYLEFSSAAYVDSAFQVFEEYFETLNCSEKIQSETVLEAVSDLGYFRVLRYDNTLLTVATDLQHREQAQNAVALFE